MLKNNMSILPYKIKRIVQPFNDGDQQILPVGIYKAVRSLSWHTNAIINPAVFLERCLDGAAFQEDPTSWTECLGQWSLASFPPWFNKEIANLHMLLLPLLQNEILSRCLKTAGERNDVSEERWLLIKTICRTMDNLRSRSRLWSAGKVCLSTQVPTLRYSLVYTFYWHICLVLMTTKVCNSPVVSCCKPLGVPSEFANCFLTLLRVFAQIEGPMQALLLPSNLSRTMPRLCPWAEFMHQCRLGGRGEISTASWGGVGVPRCWGGRSCTPIPHSCQRGPSAPRLAPALPTWALITLKSAFPVPFLESLVKELAACD
ncbi:uncharacterized protein LOC128154131 isoform X2 [Harpia harpyja]|uniref:uncharacterized protein LOC128154131 isoform X2 n=1 Tax=Harpia harpyja TaxID=202280 RepID=UPI0022B09C12|nr:uncharacterized protein LOC128154131 isoform X2 [Harpia harpyja]